MEKSAGAAARPKDQRHCLFEVVEVQVLRKHPRLANLQSADTPAPWTKALAVKCRSPPDPSRTSTTLTILAVSF